MYSKHKRQGGREDGLLDVSICYVPPPFDNLLLLSAAHFDNLLYFLFRDVD